MVSLLSYWHDSPPVHEVASMLAGYLGMKPDDKAPEVQQDLFSIPGVVFTRTPKDPK